MAYAWLKMQAHRYALVADAQGLNYVAGPDEPLTEVAKVVAPGALDEVLLAPYLQAFDDYLRGRSRSIDVPLHLLYGTPFQRDVWQALRLIPYGQTVSYQQLAQMANHETAVRAVASAVGKNPTMIMVPCHRVIRSTGEIGQFGGGVPMKRALLALEQGQPASF